jgi:hypothetical protein
MTANVEIDLGFFPLLWMLLFVRPRLSIDGVVEKSRWAKHSIELAPGRHVIEAWFLWLLPGQVCHGSTVIEVVPGRSYKLRYRPTWPLVAGKITSSSAAT